MLLFKFNTTGRYLQRIHKCFLVYKTRSVKREFFSIKDIIQNKEIYTIPNAITISRIISSPALGIAIAYDMKVVALSGCLIFAFSDWLDGYLAKVLNQRTVLGGFLDPVADKFMIGSLSAGLLYQGLIPAPLVVVIIGRDVILVALSFIKRYMERPPGSPFFDTTHSATFSIVPSNLSKANTACQFLVISATLSQFAFGIPDVTFIQPLWWICGATTITSGLGYINGSGMKNIKK